MASCEQVVGTRPRLTKGFRRRLGYHLMPRPKCSFNEVCDSGRSGQKARAASPALAKRVRDAPSAAGRAALERQAAAARQVGPHGGVRVQTAADTAPPQHPLPQRVDPVLADRSVRRNGQGIRRWYGRFLASTTTARVGRTPPRRAPTSLTTFARLSARGPPRAPASCSAPALMNPSLERCSGDNACGTSLANSDWCFATNSAARFSGLAGTTIRLTLHHRTRWTPGWAPEARRPGHFPHLKTRLPD